ncbi:MAG TPA: hypothetical protein VFD49_25970 [Candidatus Dormibacteraeota bacterium]|nr:hypothetical protein [Candidatus Dormibacteraeota bacterium]
MSKTKKLLKKGGGPGGYDIYVDPDALRAVSSYFKSRLAAFDPHKHSFISTTPHQDGEFGKLPLDETRRVNDQYVHVQGQAVQSLNDLTTWLGQIADALKMSADLYDGADGVK